MYVLVRKYYVRTKEHVGNNISKKLMSKIILQLHDVSLATKQHIDITSIE